MRAPQLALDDPWRASDPCRRAQLGLADAEPHGRIPEHGGTADLLAWALVAPGARDPVEGMIEGVRADLATLAELSHSPAMVATLCGLARRLEVAMLLLAWCDNRRQMPPEYDPDASTTTEGAEEPRERQEWERPPNETAKVE